MNQHDHEPLRSGVAGSMLPSYSGPPGGSSIAATMLHHPGIGRRRSSIGFPSNERHLVHYSSAWAPNHANSSPTLPTGSAGSISNLLRPSKDSKRLMPAFGVIQFLESLDFGEYIQTFIAEGFDRMESLMEIQEEDFEAMGIKRGHRRIIQRELLNMSGLPPNAPLLLNQHVVEDDKEQSKSDGGNSSREVVSQTNRNIFYLQGAAPVVGDRSLTSPILHPTKDGIDTVAGGAESSEQGSKRRYRRHPKPDSSAPEKPPSAYVQFSQSVREELKGKSFTEIARTVGEKWQNLDREEKDRLEARATEEKEKYAKQFSAYKETPEYARYQEYLAEFKRKNPLGEPSPVPTPNSSGVSASPGAPGQMGGQSSNLYSTNTPPPLHSRSSGEESAAEYGMREVRPSQTSRKSSDLITEKDRQSPKSPAPPHVRMDSGGPSAGPPPPPPPPPQREGSGSTSSDYPYSDRAVDRNYYAGRDVGLSSHHRSSQTGTPAWNSNSRDWSRDHISQSSERRAERDREISSTAKRRREIQNHPSEHEERGAWTKKAALSNIRSATSIGNDDNGT